MLHVCPPPIIGIGKGGLLEKGSSQKSAYFRGFQSWVFVRGGDLNNWGRARTGCNS